MVMGVSHSCERFVSNMEVRGGGNELGSWGCRVLSAGAQLGFQYGLWARGGCAGGREVARFRWGRDRDQGKAGLGLGFEVRGKLDDQDKVWCC